MTIIFDFDGTIIKSSQLHKKGWDLALKQLNIDDSLDILLPYEPNLKERFDSYRRIKSGFIENKKIFNKVSGYFQSNDKSFLVKSIMDLKENMTISNVMNMDTYDLISLCAVNLTPALMELKDNKNTLGIISSTRKTIITSILTKLNLVDLFDEIVGEESMYKQDILMDKPDRYSGDIFSSKTNKKIDVYVGDNDLIDREFSNNYRCKFILMDYKFDMFNLKNLI